MTNSNSMTFPQKNVRFVSSNYPEKQPCWGTKRSAWTSDEEAPSSTPHSSSMNAKMSSSSSSSRRSCSFYQRILFPPKRQELFVYELPECLFIHNEEKISERSEEFGISFNDEDRTMTKTTTTTTKRIRNSAPPNLKSILKKSQCNIHQALLSGTPQQLQTSVSTSKSKSLFKKNRNKNKKNIVPISRRVSDINSSINDSNHTDSSSISSSSSSSSMNKTSTSLSRKHRDSFLDLQSLL
jgi:hypothetical protein